MMAEIKAVISTPGKLLLTQALTGYKLFRPAAFHIGSVIGFDPSPTADEVAGPVVFRGDRLDIQARAMAADTARYVLTVAEGEGPFEIGNIMMFAENDDQTMIPFAFIVLPFVYQKTVADPNIPSVADSAVPIPGNRFVCNITIKHSIDATLMQVEVITPTFSSLASFRDLSVLPAPLLNQWDTFIIHDHEKTNSPSLATKRDDDTYWGVPFWQKLYHPDFGVIDGGRDGDGYKSDQSIYATGNTYLTPESKFRGRVGGGTYTTPDTDFLGTVGGIPYGDN